METLTLYRRADDATGPQLRQMHKYSPAHDNCSDFTATPKAVIVKEMKSQPYAQTFNSTEWVLPVLADVFSAVV